MLFVHTWVLILVKAVVLREKLLSALFMRGAGTQMVHVLKFLTQITSSKSQRYKIFQYPTKEVNGFIWAWHHLLKEEPYFDLPVIEGFNGDDEKWSKVFEYEYKINTVLQEIAENDVDQAHFPKVHGSPTLQRPRRLLMAFTERPLQKR